MPSVGLELGGRQTYSRVKKSPTELLSPICYLILEIHLSTVVSSESTHLIAIENFKFKQN